MRSSRERDLNMFKETMRRLGKVTNGVFDEIDMRRRKGETEVTISRDIWNKLPNKVIKSFATFFHIYLIVKHKHHRAIDVRAHKITGHNDHGIIFSMRNDVGGKGWFNNGSY